MKLYFFAGRWQVPGQQDRKAERVEIPTDSHGLCDWLNEQHVTLTAGGVPCFSCGGFGCDNCDGAGLEPLEASQMPQERDSSASATQVAPEPQIVAGGRLTCSQIEEFLFDHATVAEVERIFAAIGTRFAELRR